MFNAHRDRRIAELFQEVRALRDNFDCPFLRLDDTHFSNWVRREARSERLSDALETDKRIARLEKVVDELGALLGYEYKEGPRWLKISTKK